jgi:DNA-binding CsgD family transcriptional regulator
MLRMSSHSARRPAGAASRCRCPGCARGEACHVPVHRYAEVAHSPDPQRRLMARTLDMLTGAVPARLAAFCPVNERGEQTAGAVVLQRGRALRGVEHARREYVQRYAREDPFAPAHQADGGPAVVTVDELGGQLAFARSAYGGEYLPGFGYATEAMAYVREAGRIVAAIALLRTAQEPGFSAGEAAFLRRAVPALEVAYACAREPAPPVACEELLRARGLTGREREVARLAARGATNGQIARELLLAEATVKTHLRRVYAKLGVRTRTRLSRLLGAQA